MQVQNASYRMLVQNASYRMQDQKNAEWNAGWNTPCRSTTFYSGHVFKTCAAIAEYVFGRCDNTSKYILNIFYA